MRKNPACSSAFRCSSLPIFLLSPTVEPICFRIICVCALRVWSVSEGLRALAYACVVSKDRLIQARGSPSGARHRRHRLRARDACSPQLPSTPRQNANRGPSPSECRFVTRFSWGRCCRRWKQALGGPSCRHRPRGAANACLLPAAGRWRPPHRLPATRVPVRTHWRVLGGWAEG